MKIKSTRRQLYRYTGGALFCAHRQSKRQATMRLQPPLRYSGKARMRNSNVFSDVRVPHTLALVGRILAKIWSRQGMGTMARSLHYYEILAAGRLLLKQALSQFPFDLPAVPPGQF